MYCLVGLGGSYYLGESAPSVYFNGAIGLGYINFDTDILDNATGGAALIGVGIEPVRDLHIDLNYTNVMAEGGTRFRNVEQEYDLGVTQLMIGYTWF